MKHEISKLSNGLQVVAAPLKERRSVAVGIWVHIGGRDEEPRLNGVSHFLEHLVFKGTTSRTANQIKEAVEGRGGSLNAFTSEEYTCFLAKASSKHFESVFDVLSDMVLNASLKKEDIDKERTVVMEEIKMTQDQPSQLVEEFLSEILWPTHPLGRPLTGTLETVGSMSQADIKHYKESHYHPASITVAAAGDIDQKALIKAAESRFGASRSGASKKTSLFQRQVSPQAPKVFNKATEQTHLALGVHTFPKEHPDEYVLDVLSVLLGGNMSSRLFNEVREERGLAYDIGSSIRKYHETGAFVVSAGVDNVKFKEAVEVILSELQKITKELVGPEELLRAKEFYTGQLDLGLENTMNNMLWVGENVVTLGRTRSLKEIYDAVERVTAEDLRRVAKSMFASPSYHLSVVGPVPEKAEKDLARLLAL